MIATNKFLEKTSVVVDLCLDHKSNNKLERKKVDFQEKAIKSSSREKIKSIHLSPLHHLLRHPFDVIKTLGGKEEQRDSDQKHVNKDDFALSQSHERRKV